MPMQHLAYDDIRKWKKSGNRQADLHLNLIASMKQLLVIMAGRQPAYASSPFDATESGDRQIQAEQRHHGQQHKRGLSSLEQNIRETAHPHHCDAPYAWVAQASIDSSQKRSHQLLPHGHRHTNLL